MGARNWFFASGSFNSLVNLCSQGVTSLSSHLRQGVWRMPCPNCRISKADSLRTLYSLNLKYNHLLLKNEQERLQENISSRKIVWRLGITDYFHAGKYLVISNLEILPLCLHKMLTHTLGFWQLPWIFFPFFLQWSIHHTILPFHLNKIEFRQYCR